MYYICRHTLSLLCTAGLQLLPSHPHASHLIDLHAGSCASLQTDTEAQTSTSSIILVISTSRTGMAVILHPVTLVALNETETEIGGIGMNAIGTEDEIEIEIEGTEKGMQIETEGIGIEMQIETETKTEEIETGTEIEGIETGMQIETGTETERIGTRIQIETETETKEIETEMQIETETETEGIETGMQIETETEGIETGMQIETETEGIEIEMQIETGIETGFEIEFEKEFTESTCDHAHDLHCFIREVTLPHIHQDTIVALLTRDGNVMILLHLSVIVTTIAHPLLISPICTHHANSIVTTDNTIPCLQLLVLDQKVLIARAAVVILVALSASLHHSHPRCLSHPQCLSHHHHPLLLPTSLHLALPVMKGSLFMTVLVLDLFLLMEKMKMLS